MLELNELTVHNGEKSVLRGLSLTVKDKGIFGILGSDSEEKTMLAQVICGCRDADSGNVLINGAVVNRKSKENKKKIRLVPSDLCIESMCTAVEYLDFVGDALGVDTEKRYKQINEAIELVGIEAVQNKPFSALDLSARCRLNLAAALIGNPTCIVLDEPFKGVDATSQNEIYELLRMLGKIKILVLLSHRPDEVRSLCENVAIISDGKIAICGSISEIEQKINSTQEHHITVRGNEKSIVEAINEIDGVVGVKLLATEKNDIHSISVEHYPDEKITDKMFSALLGINAPMLSFKKITLTFDDVYYSLTSQETPKVENNSEQISARTKKKRREN